MSAATNCPASRLAKALLLGFLLQGVLIGQLAGQITLSNTNTVSENFDSMGTNAAAVLPNGFKMTAAGQGTLAGWETLANVTNVNVQASSGSPTTGGRYNWGSSATERAAGFMTSGGYASPNGIMAKVVNNIGSTMTELNISFDVERYRINSAAASVSFFSSLDGSTWTSVPAGDTGAFPTNASSYTFTNGTIVSKTLSLSGLSVSNGGAVYLKWNFNTTGSSSQGLGLDNLALQAVAQSADAPVITSASTASAVGFTSFSYQITATQSPTSYSATGLPAGLSVDSSTGLVSGVPTEQGVFNVTISASNDSGTGSAQLTLTVAKNPGAPTITSPLAAAGELFSPFSYQIVATDSPTSYAATNLHPGLTIDPATGLISGSPTVSGNRNVAISASNALGVDTQTLALFIGTSPVINPPTAASAYVNAAVSWQVSAAGPATSYSATGLPAGFSINTGTGLITGTAAATTGTSTFQVTASNALGSATQTMTLAVLDQAAQNAIPLNVVINKYANSTPDQIQLLVVGNGTPGSTVDMRGMVIKDFSSSMGGDGGGKYAFADDPLWAAVPCGTFVALSAGATAAEDFDLADFHVAVNLDNTVYFTNVGGVAMDVATTEMIMVKAAGTGALGAAGGIHCMGSGAAGAQFNAFLGAKLLGSGTTPAGFGAFASNATSALIDYGASGGAAATGATGNTAVGTLNFSNWNNSSNQAYVLSLRGSSTTPAIILNPASVTTLTAIAGSAGAGEPFQVSGANLTGNLTVTAPASFEVSTTSATTGFGATATIAASGALAATDVWVRIASTAPSGAIGPANVTVSGGGAPTQNVSVSGTVTGSGPASIGLNPTSATNLVAFTGSPGTVQQIAVIGTNLPGTVNFAADSNEYEVASQGGNFGVAASLPASGGVALVRIKSGSTNGAVGAAQLVFESGSGLSKVTNSIPLNGTRISGGTGGLVPGLQTFANDLNFTATARFVWVLKSDTVIGRGTEFSGVNVGGNLGVSAGASFDVVLNGAGSSTDFSMDFWKSARSWLVFSVTGNTTGAFSLGAITPDSGGKYYASYGSFSLRTDVGGDVYLDWTPSGVAVPSISVSTPSLSLPGTTTNVVGASTNFNASGVNLANNITVTVADALNFAVSTNSSSGFASSLILTNTSGAVAATPVYVRLTGAAAGSVNSVVNLVSGATSNSVTVSGTVNLPGAATLSPANNTALSGFATVRGTSSTNQTFTLSGSNLAAPVTLTPPPGWQISASNSNSFTASPVTIATNPAGVVSNTAIHVRLAGTNATATNYTASILPLAVPGSLTNNVLLSGSVTDPVPVITRTPTSLSNFTTVRGTSSTSQSFTLSGSNLAAPLTITPPAGWQISATNTNNFTAAAVIIATNPAGVVSNTAIHVRLAGTNAVATNFTNVVLTLVSAAASNNVLLSGTVTNPPPVLTADPASLTNFFAVAGTPSAVTNYILRGSNLSSVVSIAAPAGFQVALTNTNSAFTNTLSITNNGSISNSIWVRVSSNALTNTNLTGSITNTAAALVTNVALQARVVPAPTLSAVPTALSNFSTITGIASTNQTFNLTASNLLGPVSMTVTNGYEISLNPSTSYSTSVSVSLASASDSASNYGSGGTTTAIAFVGSEAGSPVQNWSDPIVPKSYATGGNLVYGTAGYYQIRPTPSVSPSNVNQSASTGNDLGVSAISNPTLFSAPVFAASVTGGAGNFVNFGPYPVFSGPNGSALFRQGALSVSVNAGPFNSPAGTNASYFGVPYEFTIGTSGRFRIGLVVDAVADGTYSPNYVSLYSPAAGTVFSTVLMRDGTPDMVFFDVTANAGDTFTVGLWQNTGTQSVAALSLVTFDTLPATAAGWTNGANGGTGFGPWSISVDNNPPTYFAGAFVGDPTFAGITGFGTNAFGLYANPAGTAAAVSADRPFSSPLKVGETFSFQWAVNWDAGGGNKGFNVYSGGAGGTQLANVNQGDFPGNITFNGVNAITNFGTGPMTWSFTMTSSTNLLVTSTARDGSTNIAFTTNIAVSGPPDAARWYTTAMTPGDQRQSYFNNLRIAYTSANISNLPVYARLASNAPVSEAPNSLLSSVSIATPGAASGSSASSLSVVNGNFRNLSGLTPQSAEWYGGVPAGWNGRNTNFTVRELDPVPSGNYAANLNTLTSVSPTFSPLYQAVGTLSSSSVVSVSFDIIHLIAGPPQVGVGIFDTKNSANYSDWVALALPGVGQFTNTGSTTLQTSVAINAGTPIGIAFWQAGAGAAAIDNVSVSPSGGSGTSVSLSGSVIDRPSVAVSTNSITNLITTNGYFSAPTNFTVTGRNLSNNLTLTVTPTNANNFQVSTNGLDWTNFLSFAPATNRAVSNSVQVRITATAPVTNALGGNLAVATEGALSGANISLLGIVLPDTNIPVVTSSTYALSGLGSVEGSPGASTNFAVSGNFLRGPITVTATNSFIAVSTNNLDFGSAVTVPKDDNNQVISNTVYVRISEFAPVSTNTNVFLGNLRLATTVNSNNLPAPTNIAVSGTVTNWPIANPYGIRVTNPVDFVSTSATNFTFRGQIGTSIDRATLSWFNLLDSQTAGFVGDADFTWSASVPLGIGNNTLVFSGQYLTNAGATNVASDAAGDGAYAGADGWADGDNGGFGFGPWQLRAEEGLSALYRTDTWASPNMNVSAFYGFAFESIVGGTADAYRSFDAPLQAPGGSFTVWFDSNDLQPQGIVGMRLVGSNKTPLFTFAAVNDGSGERFLIGNGTNAALDPGWAYTRSGMLLRFEMTSSNAYSFTATGANFTNTTTGTISNPAIAGISFFTDGAGPAPACNLYVGQMQQNQTLYSYESVSTVAPEVERTGAPASAYELWARGHGLDPAGSGAPGSDHDRDGFSNDAEFAFGTSPLSADAQLTRAIQSGGNVVITFVARAADVAYTVVHNAHLDSGGSSWVDSGIVPGVAGDQTGVPPNYQRRTFSVPASGRNFYRVRATIAE